MNKKKLLLTLAMGMMLGGCGRNSNQSEQTEDQSITDTMLVIGVWNRPETKTDFARKGLLCIDKNGFRHEYYKKLNGKNVQNGELIYIQRGDTVCINGGEVIENLTTKHMAERYVKGR